MRARTRDDVRQFRRLNIGLYQGKSALALVVAAVRMVEVGGNSRAEVVDCDHLVATSEETVDQG